MPATARNLTRPLARFATEPVKVPPHMTAMAAVGGSRRTRLRYIAERRGFLATLLISPAVLFILALVGVPLVLAVYLSFTDAQAGSLTGKWVGLANFRNALHDPIVRGALWHTFLFTATDMVVLFILTNGGPFNSTQVLTTYAFLPGINAGNIGEGAAIALFMLPVLALVVIGMLVFARRAEVT